MEVGCAGSWSSKAFQRRNVLAFPFEISFKISEKAPSFSLQRCMTAGKQQMPLILVILGSVLFSLCVTRRSFNERRVCDHDNRLAAVLSGPCWSLGNTETLDHTIDSTRKATGNIPCQLRGCEKNSLSLLAHSGSRSQNLSFGRGHET